MRALALLGWALAAVLVSAWLAVVEVLWLQWRVGGVLVPLSVLVAVVGNQLLVGAAAQLSGSRLVGLLPAVGWVAVAIGGSVQTAEGDLLITGSTTATGVEGLAFLLLGVVSASFAVGRVLSRPATPGAGRRVSRAAAGSGSGGAR